MTIDIVIIDDHPIVLLGTKILLERNKKLNVAGKFVDYDELEAFLSTNTCDLIITDFSLPGKKIDGLKLIEKIRRLYTDIPLIILTSVQNPSLLFKSLDYGVSAIIEKGENKEELISAICKVINGERYISTFYLNKFADVSLNASKNLAPNLTPKEIEVIRLLASGLTQAEVAIKLSRSIKTISWTKISAKHKLKIKSDAELFQYAIQAL